MTLGKSFFVKQLIFLVVFLLLPVVSWASYGDTISYLGKVYDGDGDSARSAYLDFAEDVAFSSTGKMVIADTYNNVIRGIDTSNKAYTVAGTGSYGDKIGATGSAEFALPRGIAVASNGTVYVADTANNKIKKISSGNVTTLVDDGLSQPEGVAVRGSTLYIADTGNNAIKKVSTSGGSVTTVASSISSPKKLTSTSSGQHLYVAAGGSYKVIKVTVSSGAKSVIAGSGTAGYVDAVGTSARFRNVVGVSLDETRNSLYVTDGNGYADYVREIDLSDNTVTTLATDEVMSTINYPKGITSRGDYVYIANSGIGTIQRCNKDTGSIDAEADWMVGKKRFGHEFGSSSNSLLGRPNDMVFSPNGQSMYVAENNFLRKVNMSNSYTSFVAGSIVDAYREDTGDQARFSSIASLTINSTGTTLYLTDRWNNRIRSVNLSNNTSALVSGGGETDCSGSCNGYVEGSKNSARFNNPAGIAISADNAYLFVADTSNNRIRKVRISDGQTWLLAGSGVAGHADGKGSVAKFDSPFGITIDSAGEYLYVADRENHRLRRIKISTGDVTTVAGSGSNGYRDAIGTTAVLSYPEYVKVGADGNLYFTEVGSQLVKFMDISTRSVRTIAGNLNRGFKNGDSTSSRFNNPKGLLPDTANSKLYVADNWNDTIRRISIPDEPPYSEPAPQPTSVSPLDRYKKATSSSQILSLNIGGSNFTHGASAMFGSYGAVKTYVNASNELTVEIPFGQMPPAYYNVKVTSMDGQSGTCEKCFIVLNPDGSLPPEAQVEESQVDFDAYDVRQRGGYHIYSGNVFGGALSPDEIVTGTEEGFGPQVSIFDGNGNVIGRFFAYAEHLRSGVRIATCDLDNDGTEEIVTAPGKGGRPHIRIFNAQGEPTVHPGFFALDGKFKGGANIACGDVNADGRAEIIVAAAQGGGPHVTVHNYKSEVIASFMAYDTSFRGGIRLATADFNDDGRYEIVTGPESGAPHVQMFNATENEVRRLNPGFYAFHPTFGGGLSLTGGDVDGDGDEEIIVSQRTQGQAWVKVYSGQDQAIMKTFLAYAPSFEGGAVVTAGDTDGDGKDEVMTMPGSGGSPQVRVFDVE
ncbi:MAG: hypothetical protein HQ530_04635 [Parcubacteria group bacterium]|nr:hypothetical protein [Parcubacteria group bacterium]